MKRRVEAGSCRPGWRWSCLVGALLASATAAQAPADPPPAADLRGIRVGMTVGELPRSGFVGFTCAEAPSKPLSGFEQWRDCPANQGGRAVRFGFDPAGAREGTMVAGHPVILTLRISDDERVRALAIETDPQARTYLRKKAFLLGLQARSQYGDAGWNCQEGSPQAGEEPVGGVYVRERCSKHVADRVVDIERNLYRRSDQDTRQFVGRTRIDIRWDKG